MECSKNNDQRCLSVSSQRQQRWQTRMIVATAPISSGHKSELDLDRKWAKEVLYFSNNLTATNPTTEKASWIDPKSSFTLSAAADEKDSSCGRWNTYSTDHELDSTSMVRVRVPRFFERPFQELLEDWCFADMPSTLVERSKPVEEWWIRNLPCILVDPANLLEDWCFANLLKSREYFDS